MSIIPQRFQLVYGTSGLDAGVRLIPFTVTMPLGIIFASAIAGKFKIPPLYLLLAGSCLQVLGFALLGTLPVTLEVPRQIYAFEIIAGWGCGMNYTLLFLMIPFVNKNRYHCKSNCHTLYNLVLLISIISGWDGSGRTIPVHR